MQTGLSFLQTAKYFLLACTFSICMVGQTPTPIRSVATLPATCNGGSATAATDVVFLVTGTSGEFYRCWASNTWVIMGTMPTDNVHAGSVQLGGNTTPPILNSSTFSWIGPNSASFTAWGVLMPIVEPSNTSLLAFGAASSHVSTGSLIPLQGNGANIQTAGTVAGTGAALCTTAGGAATTVGCPQSPVLSVFTADYTNSTTSNTPVSSCAFPLSASRTYLITVNLIWQGSSATAFPQLADIPPVGTTHVGVSVYQSLVVEASPTFYTAANDSSTGGFTVGATSGSFPTATDIPMTVTYTVINGLTPATWQLLAKSSGSGTITFKTNSYCSLQVQ